jgi:hypothetical protein
MGAQFTVRRTMRGDTATEWYDRELGAVGEKVEQVKVALHYFKDARPRGIYLVIREVVGERSTVPGITTESYSLTNGNARTEWGTRRYSILVAELARGNPKLLAKVATAIEPWLENLAELVRLGDAVAIENTVAFIKDSLRRGA